MERWYFFQNNEGNWCWRRINADGETVAKSKSCFSIRKDCIVDAMEHGYMAAPKMPARVNQLAR